jgi:GNAT superfamily N-acetyltransferase
MPIAWNVTAATAADVPDILAMIRALAEYERLSQLCVADEALLSAALFGERPAAECLVAREGRENGAAAGFALFFHSFSTFRARRGIWLEDLFVYPRYRGQGIGRALLSEVGRIARNRGCARLEWAVLDWNAPAIAFYEGMGAKLMPEWKLARVAGDDLTRFGG